MSNKEDLLSNIKYSVAGVSLATIFAGIQTFVQVNSEYAISQSAIYVNYAVIVMALAAAITFGIKAYLLFKEMNNDAKVEQLTTTISLDFEDKILNAKVENIKQIIQGIQHTSELVSHEDKMIVDKTLTSYIPTIAYNYVAIPQALRKVATDEQSAYSMVLQQLEIIENGLKEMQTVEKPHYKAHSAQH